MNVIDCDDISSENFYPLIICETPEDGLQTACTQYFNELEESSENESGDSQSQLSKHFIKTEKCGLKIKRLFQGLQNT